MRKSANWMQLLDERILEHLSEDDWATPQTIYRETDFDALDASEARIAERCEELVSRELIAPIHGDMYEITRWGLAYLDGRLDAHHLRRWGVG